jgi:hypothetical protein
MSVPPNFRPAKEFKEPSCHDCFYLRVYDFNYACIKHYCYVALNEVCDDHEDGKDYRFGLEFIRPTTRKEHGLLKVVLGDNKAPESSNVEYPHSKLRRGENADRRVETEQNNSERK